MKEMPFVFCLLWETGLLLPALLPNDLAEHEKSGMYVADSERRFPSCSLLTLALPRKRGLESGLFPDWEMLSSLSQCWAYLSLFWA